jgi:hypothetical protein
MFPKRPYNPYIVYNVQLKSLDEITALGGKYTVCDKKRYNCSPYNCSPGDITIIHSSGRGGGMTVTGEFIRKFMGTKRDISVRFSKMLEGDLRADDRCIFIVTGLTVLKTQTISLYSEWFTDPAELPEELFEL